MTPNFEDSPRSLDQSWEIPIAPDPELLSKVPAEIPTRYNSLPTVQVTSYPTSSRREKSPKRSHRTASKKSKRRADKLPLPSPHTKSGNSAPILPVHIRTASQDRHRRRTSRQTASTDSTTLTTLPRKSSAPIRPSLKQGGSVLLLSEYGEHRQNPLNFLLQSWGKEKRLLLGLIGDKDSSFFRDSIIHRLATQLIASSTSVAHNSYRFQSHLALLISIQSQEKQSVKYTRKKLLLSVGKSNIRPDPQTQPIPLALRIVTQLLTAMLQVQESPIIQKTTIVAFVEVLSTLPPLCLANDASDYIDSLYIWLLKTIRTEVSQLPPPHPDAPGPADPLSQSILSAAFEALIGLGVCRGALPSILAPLAVLQFGGHLPSPFSPPWSILEVSTRGSIAQLPPLSVATWLRQLASFRFQFPLSPLAHPLLFEVWPIESKLLRRHQGGNHHNLISITCDAQFLYIHTGHFLRKIGLGYQGTVKGSEYYVTTAPTFPSDATPAALSSPQRLSRSFSEHTLLSPTTCTPGFIACINHLLYLFSPTDLGRLHLFSPADFKPLRAFPLLLPNHTTLSICSMITDGLYLYFIRYDPHRNEIFITRCNPLPDRVAVLSEIQLTVGPGDHTIPYNAELLNHCAYYTNGVFLVILIPSEYVISPEPSNSWICQLFSLVDGQLVAHQNIFPPIGTAACFDHFHNVIWNYSPTMLSVAGYSNIGIPPKYVFNPLPPPEHPSASPSPVSPVTAVADILRAIAQLAQMCSPHDHLLSLLKTSGLHEIMCIDVGPQTFELLYQMLRRAVDEVSLPTNPSRNGQARIILYITQILTAHFHRLASSDQSLDSLGLSRPQPSYRRALDDLTTFQPLVSPDLATLSQPLAETPPTTAAPPHSAELVFTFRTSPSEDHAPKFPFPFDRASPPQNLLANLRACLLGLIYLCSPTSPCFADLAALEDTQQHIAEAIRHAAIRAVCCGLDALYPKITDQTLLLIDLLGIIEVEAHHASPSLPGLKELIHAIIEFQANRGNIDFLIAPQRSVSSRLSVRTIPCGIELRFSPGPPISQDSLRDSVHFFHSITGLMYYAIMSTNLKPGTHDWTEVLFKCDMKIDQNPYFKLLSSIQHILIRHLHHPTSRINYVGTFICFVQLFAEESRGAFAKALQLETLSSQFLERLRIQIHFGVVWCQSLFSFGADLDFIHKTLPYLLMLLKSIHRFVKLHPLHPPEPKSSERSPDLSSDKKRQVESPHPYGLKEQMETVVTIPGSAYLTLIFNPRCSTLAGEDELKIYSDLAKTNQIGPTLSGSSRNWPSTRILVPGHTVLFVFQANSSRQQHSNAMNRPDKIWGFQCSILGNRSPGPTKPIADWLSFFFQSLISLVAHFTGALISGPELSASEVACSEYLNGVLCSGGLLAPDFLAGLPLPLSFSAEAPPSAKTALAILRKFPANDTTECEPGLVTLLHVLRQHVMSHHVPPSQKHLQSGELAQLQLKLFAALVWHAQLLPETLAFALALSENQLATPHPALAHFFHTISNLLFHLLQSRQSCTAHVSSPPSFDTYLELVHRQTDLLLSLAPLAEPLSPPEIANACLSFVLKPQEVLSYVLQYRQTRAELRALGLRSFRKLISSTLAISSLTDLISVIGPALRSSTQAPPTWPSHFLDHLDGCSLNHRQNVRHEYWAVVRRLMELLSVSHNQPGILEAHLHRMALDVLILTFKGEDIKKLQELRVFHTLNVLTSSALAENRSFARILFFMLAAQCVAHPSVPENSELFPTLAHLLMSRLPISRLHTGDPLSHADNFEITEVISMLHAFCMGCRGLSRELTSPDYIADLLLVAVRGGELIRERIFRLFRLILPHCDPNLKLSRYEIDIHDFFISILEVNLYYSLSFKVSSAALSRQSQRIRTMLLTLPEKTSRHLVFEKLPYFPPFFCAETPTSVKPALPTGFAQNRSPESSQLGTISIDERVLSFPSPPEFLPYSPRISLGDEVKASSAKSSRSGPAPASFQLATQPVPTCLRGFYYEIEIESHGEGVCLGLHKQSQANNNLVDTSIDNYCYHVHSGKISCSVDNKQDFQPYTNPRAEPRLIVGCFWDCALGTIHFSVDGVDLGIAFKNVRGIHWPVVGITPGVSIFANFGQAPFKMNLSEIGVRIRGSDLTTPPSIFGLAADSVLLLRSLFSSSKSWEQALQHRINQDFENYNADIRSTSSDSHRYFLSVLAQLEILGAHLEFLRIGARVRCSTSPAQVLQSITQSHEPWGTVAKCDPHSPYCHVILDSEIASMAKIKLPKAQLVLDSEIPAHTIVAQALNGRFIDIFCLLVDHLRTTSPSPERNVILAHCIRAAFAWFNPISAIPNDHRPLSEILLRSPHLNQLLTSLLVLATSPLNAPHARDSGIVSIHIMDRDSFALRWRFLNLAYFQNDATTPLRSLRPSRSSDGRRSHRASEETSIGSSSSSNTGGKWSNPASSSATSVPPRARWPQRASRVTTTSASELIIPLSSGTERKPSISLPLDTTQNISPRKNEASELGTEIRMSRLGLDYGQAASSHYHIEFRDITLGTVFLVSPKDIPPATATPHWVPLMDQTIGCMGVVIAKDPKDASLLLRVLDQKKGSGVAAKKGGSVVALESVYWWYHHSWLTPFRHFVSPTMFSTIDSLSPAEDLIPRSNLQERTRIVMFSRHLISIMASNLSFLPAITQVLVSHPLLATSFFRFFTGFSRHLSDADSPSRVFSWHPEPIGLKPVQIPTLLTILQCYYQEYSRSLSEPVGFNLLSKSIRQLPDSSPTMPVPVDANSSATFGPSQNWQGQSEVIPQLVSDSVKHLMASLRATGSGISSLTVESTHPYPSGTPVRRLLYLEDAQNLLVVFSWRCSIVPDDDFLRFSLDPFGEQVVACCSGRGPTAFPNFVVPANRVWMHFECTSDKQEWGYRFEVSPIVSHILDPSEMGFDHSLCVIEVLLQSPPKLAASLYTTEVFQVLISQLDSTTSTIPLDRRLRIIVAVTRLLQRWNLFPSPPDVSTLSFAKREARNLIVQEQAMGAMVHSLYLQSLLELIANILQLEACLQPMSTSTPEKDTSSRLHRPVIRVDSFLSNAYTTRSSLNTINSMGVTGAQAHISSIFELTNLLSQLQEIGIFPTWFVRSATSDECKNLVVEESPHPYPSGVRVTAAINIPRATSLLVQFDHRCAVNTGQDFLMFSRIRPGGSDLAMMTGAFGGRKFEVNADNLIWSFHSDSELHRRSWGFRFSVVPTFPAEVVAELEAQSQQLFERLVSKNNGWNRLADQDLVHLINTFAASDNLQVLSMRAMDFNFPRLKHSSSFLHALPSKEIEDRFILLNYFNRRIAQVIGSINFQNTHSGGIAQLLFSLRSLIFMNVKNDFFDALLLETESHLPAPTLNLRRFLAVAPENPTSLVLQAIEQLAPLSPTLLRNGEQAFSVVFEGEGAQDQGGPYREAITLFWSELLDFNSPNSVVIPCPNHSGGMGENRTALLLNPNLSNAQRMQLLEFMGLLLGITLRTKQTIPDLTFAPLIWKLLVSQSVALSDLASIDITTYNALQTIRGVEDPRTFESYSFDTFSIMTTDGRIVPLKQGGLELKVTFDNRLEFANLIEAYRLHEFDLPMEAIKRGISRIIPPHVLALFTWQQLEFRICGRAEIDVGLLQKNTVYLGVQPDEPHIVAFWKVLHSLDASEKSLFLRFVWGRSSLPPVSEFPDKFHLRTFQPSSSLDPDSFFPVSSTCTFTLALPRYSSEHILRQRLLYAISSCLVIDRDFTVVKEVDFSSFESSATESIDSTTESHFF